MLVVTVHDQEEEVKVEDIRGMSPTHIAKLYTVSSLHLSVHIVHAMAVSGAVVPSLKAHAVIAMQCLQSSVVNSSVKGHCVAISCVQAQVANACEDRCLLFCSIESRWAGQFTKLQRRQQTACRHMCASRHNAF